MSLQSFRWCNWQPAWSTTSATRSSWFPAACVAEQARQSMGLFRLLVASGLAAVLLHSSVVALAAEPMITAHRGASDDAPENTLAAFRLAWQQGADAIEGDFRLSGDGQVVCIHDADTARTCGIKRVVADTPLARLRELDYGRWKGEDFAGETCPTLAEVLAVVPTGKRLYVELKTGPEIVPQLAHDLERAAVPPAAVVLIAFDETTVIACKKRLPALKVHWLTAFKESSKGSGQWRPTAQTIAETVRRCGADGVGMQARADVIDEDFVEALRSGGVGEFHVWTVDRPEDARHFAMLEAVGITTNRPAVIRESLNEQ